MSRDISMLNYFAGKYNHEDAGDICDLQDAATVAVDIIETLEDKIARIVKVEVAKELIIK